MFLHPNQSTHMCHPGRRRSRRSGNQHTASAAGSRLCAALRPGWHFAQSPTIELDM